MTRSPLLQPSTSIAILRILMGLIFMSHAINRLVHASVPGFGGWLESQGFPAGEALAWSVTIFELVGGSLMVLRKFVQLFCAGEIVILITGIILVHAPNGWFVVGQTLNGPEYSVVLIVVLIAIFLAEWKEERNIRPVL